MGAAGSRTTPQRRGTLPSGPKSAESDTVDEIYQFKDPVGVSLKKRTDAGTIHSVVANKDSTQGKFFFKIRLKGEPPKITEAAIRNKAQEEGKTDAKGNIIVEVV